MSEQKKTVYSQEIVDADKHLQKFILSVNQEEYSAAFKQKRQELKENYCLNVACATMV